MLRGGFSGALRERGGKAKRGQSPGNRDWSQLNRMQGQSPMEHEGGLGDSWISRLGGWVGGQDIHHAGQPGGSSVGRAEERGGGPSWAQA